MASTPSNAILAGWRETGATVGGRPSVLKVWTQEGLSLSFRGGEAHTSMPGRDAAGSGTRGNGMSGYPLPKPKMEAVRAGSVQDDLPVSCPPCGEEDGIVNAWRCRHGKAAGEKKSKNGGGILHTAGWWNEHSPG